MFIQTLSCMCQQQQGWTIVSVLMHTAVSCGHLKKKQHDGVELLVSIWAQLAGYRSGAAGRRLGVSVICLYRIRCWTVAFMCPM